MPRNQKIRPPSAPCSTATTILPLTVARMTVVNLLKMIALDVGLHRNRLPDAPGQGGAVAQEEKQQVQHDEKADEKIKGVLPDAQGLRGNELAALGQAFRHARLDQPQVVQARTVQQGW